MATIFHLSDLHFGALDAPVATALSTYIRALCEREHAGNDRGTGGDAGEHGGMRPGGGAMLVVSGDFTQRARPGQYREAMAWVEGLGFGQRHLYVAGNHDVPLWAFWERFVSPLGRYRRFVTGERSPVWEEEGLMVVGVTTPRAWVPVRDGFWKDGRIGRRDLAEAVRVARRGRAEGKAVVVVTHHPFLPAPGTRRGGVVLGGVRAAEDLADAGVDVLLAGHLHASYHGTVGVGRIEGRVTPDAGAGRYDPPGRHGPGGAGDAHAGGGSGGGGILSVQAGTATSVRRRHDPSGREYANAFNLLRVSPEEVEIEVHAWGGASSAGWGRASVAKYRRGATGAWEGSGVSEG